MSSTPHTAPAAPIVPELLSSKQAAQLAGVSERKWWGMTRSGQAPAPIKIGLGLRPMVRFRRSDILDWIDAGCPRIDGGPAR